MPAPALPSLTVSTSLPRAVDVLVVGHDGDGVRGVPAGVEKAFGKRFGVPVATMAAALGSTSRAGQHRTLPGAGALRIVVVGLGETVGTAELRAAAGVGVRHAGGLVDEGAVSVAVSLGSGSAAELQAVAEGSLLGTYRYSGVSSEPTPPPSVQRISVLHDGPVKTADGARVADVAPVLAKAVLTAREWVNLPANLLYPASFAEEVSALVKGTRIGVEVLDERDLAVGGYGGLLAVGGGSSRPPRLVRLSYRPRRAKHHLVLVGKGITFDSGGLNLKPADGMYTMKCDMAGAATVLAATHAIAELGLAVQVTAYGTLAENMPGPQAYRPSDVLTLYGGKTVENGNSDAEGRLVMADALARSNADSPDLVVDVATLTGACVVALGERTAAVLATDDQTARQVLAAADTADEALWPLPIPAEIRGKLDSEVADLRSTSSDRYGGALVAAAFLREFVQAGTPWAHLDIAGPAFHTGAPYGHVSSGGTGMGVRTLVALARQLTR